MSSSAFTWQPTFKRVSRSTYVQDSLVALRIWPQLYCSFLFSMQICSLKHCPYLPRCSKSFSLYFKICSFLDCLRRKRERLNWQCVLGHVTSTESFPGCLLGLYRPDLGSAESCIDFSLSLHNGRDDSECFCAFQGNPAQFFFLTIYFFLHVGIELHSPVHCTEASPSK